MYTGMDTVSMLYEMMGVEDEWAVRYENGFKWWPCERAQTVEILGEVDGPEGERGCYISIRMEVFKSESLDPALMKLLNQGIMTCPSLAGLVYNRRKGLMELCSWAPVYEHSSRWMPVLLGMAAGMQLFEADTVCFILENEKESAESGHPENGIRREVHEIYGLGSAVFQTGSQEPSRWEAEEFTEAIDLVCKLPLNFSAAAEGPGLSAEFPFGSRLSLFRMIADIPHCGYGNGLHQIHHFPVARKPGDDDKWIKKALELNKPVVSSDPPGFGFGSYVYRYGMIIHASFLPNALHNRGLLPNLLLAAGARAEAMDKELAGERRNKNE
ncbi:MAG: hypothetical protein ACOYJV_05145 [Aminivibrio sp.]|jgi:hypothetical protein